MNGDAAGSVGEWLAEGLADHVAGWAAERGGDASLLRRVTLALGAAIQEGHVALDLGSLGDAPALAAALDASGVVGSADAPGSKPLVLDGDGRLYLHRAFVHERALARCLVARLRQPPEPIGDAARDAIAALFGADAAEVRRRAATLALQRRLLVLSGGPGTGKTTMVVQLLAILRAQDPSLRMALAAPTGKAAARLADAVHQRSAALPAALRAGMPTEAMTVHRLLGLGPDGRAAHDAARPLPLDVLVVDEASMLDLSLAARLLAALPAGARLLLLGDKDQLAAVESGAVFAELASPGAGGGTPLPEVVLWLTENHRFDAESGIGLLATDIQAGRIDAAVQALRAGAGLRWLNDDSAWQPALRQGFDAYLDTVARDPQDVAAALHAFSGFAVLAALRDGPRGVLQANRWAEQHARARLAGIGAQTGGPWYPGRPVMVLRNDAGLQLFNGDIGLALPDEQGQLKVFFAGPAAVPRALAPAQLPAHETAFAITIHKAQGSEFGRVLVLLPAAPHRLLTRELLYTAVTRARSDVLLAAPEAVLAAAIAAPTRRHTGLLAQLARQAEASAAQA